MVFPTTQVSLEEFEAFLARAENRDRLFELIDGEIVEKVVSEEHGALVAYLAARILLFAEEKSLGRTTVEARHRSEGDDKNDRIPDLAFTRYENALSVVRKGAVPRTPDLAVEVKSFDDNYTDLRRKAAFYIANGARLVWLIYPFKRIIEVYRADGDIDILNDADALDGADVLPGFSLPVKQLFDSVR